MHSDPRAEAAEQTGLVVFVVGTAWYAVRIDEVREIVVPMPITALPHRPEGIAGVCDHRGEVVPIIDLRAVFGLGPADRPKKVKWVLVEVAGRTVGLVADDVFGVVRVGSGDLRRPPELAPGPLTRAISKVAAHDGKLLFVLDVSHFDQIAARASVLPRGETK